MYNIHGGNLDAIEREYGIPKDRIIDFSGNVNPLGPPASVLKAITYNAATITRYPDVEYRALREGIARYTGVGAECVIPGNGSTELISAFIRTTAPEDAVIVSPAYSEYERAVALAGGRSRLFALKPEDDFKLDVDGLIRFTAGADLLVICNPSNPTGMAVTSVELEKILAALPDTKVMVDETYAEFANAPILSGGLIPHYPNLFTVRGTSKFFAVPGLRLGYALCGDSGTREAVLALKDPWSINILSAAAGEVIFGDTAEMHEYIERTKAMAVDWHTFTCGDLSKLGSFKLYKSHANFVLVKILIPCLTAGQIADKLLRESNILIRNAASFPYLDDSYFRFCMRLPGEDAQLISALTGL